MGIFFFIRGIFFFIWEIFFLIFLLNIPENIFVCKLHKLTALQINKIVLNKFVTVSLKYGNYFNQWQTGLCSNCFENCQHCFAKCLIIKYVIVQVELNIVLITTRFNCQNVCRLFNPLLHSVI